MSIISGRNLLLLNFEPFRPCLFSFPESPPPHHVVSGDSVFLVSFGEGITYGRRNKSLGSLFKTNYETIQSLEGEALLKHVGEQLIVETKKFAEKKIKDFDLEGYIKSLEEYFNEAMQLMREGKRPDEGKVANEEIQIARAKKWSRL